MTPTPLLANLESLSHADLSVLVAERVMGWHLVAIPKDIDGKNECEILMPPGAELSTYQLAPRGLYQRNCMVPKFATDIAAAMEVLHHLKTPNVFVEIVAPLGDPHWVVTLRAVDRPKAVAWAPTLARAVCLAAVRFQEQRP